jgi:hypothetical protein
MRQYKIAVFDFCFTSLDEPSLNNSKQIEKKKRIEALRPKLTKHHRSAFIDRWWVLWSLDGEGEIP